MSVQGTGELADQVADTILNHLCDANRSPRLSYQRLFQTASIQLIGTAEKQPRKVARLIWREDDVTDAAVLGLQIGMIDYAVKPVITHLDITLRRLVHSLAPFCHRDFIAACRSFNEARSILWLAFLVLVD